MTNVIWPGPTADQSHPHGLQMTRVICEAFRWPVSSAWSPDDQSHLRGLQMTTPSFASPEGEHCHLQSLKMTALSLAICKRMTTMAHCHLQGREWDNPDVIWGAYVWQLFYMICESLDDNKMHAVVCGQWTRHNIWRSERKYKIIFKLLNGHKNANVYIYSQYMWHIWNRESFIIYHLYL